MSIVPNAISFPTQLIHNSDFLLLPCRTFVLFTRTSPLPMGKEKLVFNFMSLRTSPQTGVAIP